MLPEIVHTYLTSVDSTHLWVKRHIKDLPRNVITCVVAKNQTAGRGTHGKKWVSPEGKNLYASYYFPLSCNDRIGPNFAQLLSLSASKTLQKLGISTKLKWPNDLLLNGKKVGGVLCEILHEGDLVHVIVGIGLNVSMNEEELGELSSQATSLALAGFQVAIEEVLSKLNEQLIEDLFLYLKEGFAPFVKEYEKNLVVYEKDLTLDGEVGEMVGVDDEGYLLIRLKGGEIRRIAKSSCPE